ncbi:unnamed protein product, partial [Rhizoctonia solani]
TTPKPPHLAYPVTGPAHSRLRAELQRRYSEDADRQAAAAEADQPQPSEVDEVPETQFDSESDAPRRPIRRSNLCTYGSYRSHISSEPNTTNNATAAPTSSRPALASISASQLVQMERARNAAGTSRTDKSHLPSRRPSRLFAEALQPPASRSQPRPPLGGQGNASGRRMGGSRRLDPTSAARADMLAFNRALAQGKATSFVETVTRQSKRTARYAPPASRPRDELLDDDEEALARAEAFANRKWPPRSARTRKPKPLQRDVSGIERQVLIMAKIHLFAYALVEGIYQTRATFLRWAAAVHEATWQIELPDRPYERPDNEIFEIMVNNIATLRGRSKEYLRDFAARDAGFLQNLKSETAIQDNLARFNERYPNSFHCESLDPRQGDYESPEIGHCISLVGFHSPNSVGVLYPDYFRDMPLTFVAFCLAMWQFCIEEWANGWHQNGDLGMGAMRDKYEAHLAGLKELREIAPRRVSRLQNEWSNYAAAYSGAVFVSNDNDTANVRQSQMRPDTPELDDAISVEEMDARLLQTACEESLREHIVAMTARELEEPTYVESDDEGAGAPSPRSRASSLPPVEYNEYGVLTAASKGKGRAD